MARKKVIESAPVVESTVIEAEVTEKELSPQERINNCNVELTAILQKYNCDLFVSMILEPPNQMRPLIRIIPKTNQ